MDTLAAALRPIAGSIAAAPRVYADANLPAGLVDHMRHALGWDVLFVVEHDDLRRAADREHFRRAREFGRTLVTLDRDFGDERRFPAADGPGIVLCAAGDEAGLRRQLAHVDRTVFRAEGAGPTPLKGRVLALDRDRDAWGGPGNPGPGAPVT